MWLYATVFFMVSKKGLYLSVGENRKFEPYSEGMSIYRLNHCILPVRQNSSESHLTHKKKWLYATVFFMVSKKGLEPSRISPHAPQTCAYTDSATSTLFYLIFFIHLHLQRFEKFHLNHLHQVLVATILPEFHHQCLCFVYHLRCCH